MTKIMILLTTLCGVIFSFTISNAQQEFPRICFADPYYVHVDTALGNRNTSFADSNYYWDQITRCGFTHTVTFGDSISLNNSANLFLLNLALGDSNRLYATGMANEYPVGGDYPYQSYFDPDDMETGANIYDAGAERFVFQCSCDVHDRGIVFQDSFPDWHQRWTSWRNYKFIFTLKMDGDTSEVDSVAKVCIWETESNSDKHESGQEWLMWKDFFSDGGEKAADTIIIYSNDFIHPGTYEDIDLVTMDLQAYQMVTHISFEWLETRDLYIDNLWVRDNWNYNLFVSEDCDTHYQLIQDTLASRHAINPDQNYRWYVDEPWSNMYQSFEKVNTLSRDDARIEIPLTGATGGLNEWNLNFFASNITLDELLYDWYCLAGSTSTASSGDSSLQYAWDYLISVDDANRRGMRWASRVAHEQNPEIPFWMTIQASAQDHFESEQWVHKYRAPTANELLAQAHLALCYGAKGLAYFLYPTTKSSSQLWKFYGLVDLVDEYGNPTWNYQEGHYIPNERWYAAQEINAKIDSLDDVLLSLSWEDAFLSHPDTVTSHSTFVDSLYSSRFVPDSTYIEIGIFKNGATDYLMLVNRRCLSTETDTLTVMIDTAKSDAYMLEDMYTRDFYGCNNGVFTGITLAPGEGRLFKLVDSDETWAATINVQSSVTIPQGVQLTIEPGAEIKFAENTKLEIDGVLRAKGSTGGPLVYFTAIDTTEQWYGIRFTSSSVDSLCVMKDCSVEYAGYAIEFNGASSDTIDNIFIKHCYHGIHCVNSSSPRISSIITWDGTVPVGIYCSYSDPSINSVSLYGNGADNSKGIRIEDSSPTIQGGAIVGFERGIDICGGDPVICDVELWDNTEYGIACNWSEDPEESGDCPSSSPTIDTTDIRYNNCGIYTGLNATPDIAHNFVCGNQIGIISDNSSPTIFHNKVLGNDSIGVWCSGTTSPNLGDTAIANSGYNEICNSLWNVYSECSDTIKAQNNWWGWGQAPPDTSKFHGIIDYIPYLFQSPDSIPPARITDLTATLVDSCIALQWSVVSTDTTGKSDPVPFYFVYRDTIAGFFPEPSDSIATETTAVYVDCGVVADTSINYYYSVRAVDYGLNLSLPSNQVGEFDKYLTKDGPDEPPWE